MAQLWLQEQETEEAEVGGRSGTPLWVAREITGETSCLHTAGLTAEEAAGEGVVGGDAAGLLVRSNGPVGEVWALFGTDAVLVNGAPLLLGMRVMNDRDEIRVGCGSRSYFSTERLAEIEPFPGADRRTFCARCKTDIKKGAPAVKCPGCGVWHHEEGSDPDGLQCWSYPGTVSCAMCTSPNEYGTGYRWTPGDL